MRLPGGGWSYPQTGVTSRAAVEKQKTRSSERPSYAAAMLCKNPEFWKFINEEIEQSGDFISPTVFNEENAKQWMYQKCGISSRAELDTPSQATVTFDGVCSAFAATQGDPF